MTSEAQRRANQAYRERMREQGFVPVLVWVPNGKADEVREVAREMREKRDQ